MDACLSIMGIVNSTLPTTADFEDLASKFKSWFNVSSSWMSTQLAGYILMNTAELEFIFPNPNFAEIAISAWAQINDVRFTELYNTTTTEFYKSFEPLENYNMEETTTQKILIPELVSIHTVEGQPMKIVLRLMIPEQYPTAGTPVVTELLRIKYRHLIPRH